MDRAAQLYHWQNGDLWEAALETVRRSELLCRATRRVRTGLDVRLDIEVIEAEKNESLPSI